MAGSYKHVVNDEGMLENGETINSALECMSGDVTECVTEMYGMIWYLATKLSASTVGLVSPEALVERARTNYHLGLDWSPGVVREEWEALRQINKEE